MSDQHNPPQLPPAQDDQVILIVKDGTPRATSLEVARRFGKHHKNVLQAIERLECSDDFRRLNFQPAEYYDEQGKPRPMYEITRDGFAFLAMGFTGKEAALWKERYIRAFNDMERELREQVLPSSAPPLLDLGAELAQLRTRVQALEAKIGPSTRSDHAAPSRAGGPYLPGMLELFRTIMGSEAAREVKWIVLVVLSLQIEMGHGSPSLRRLAARAGASKSTTENWLNLALDEGWIAQESAERTACAPGTSYRSFSLNLKRFLS